MPTNIEGKEAGGFSPRISAFPVGPTAWRVDWFGDIGYPNRALRRTQPSILVHLSRVIDPQFEADPSVLLSPQSTDPPKSQRRVWVSIGTVVLLRIGDIWRDGQLLMRPEYELQEFGNVAVDRSSTTLIKAGLPLAGGEYVIPVADHPWHMQCTQSYCLMVNLPDNKRLVIPCIELIRFYFGSSSSLLAKLFLPPLVRENLFTTANKDPRTGHAQIDLAEGISRASAGDIARIAMHPLAMRAAQLVGASILRASVAQQAIYPQAAFPFEGKTDLLVSGKWLPYGNQPRATFLVFHLRSCSHPLPFQSLRYTEFKEEDARSAPDRSDAPGRASETAQQSGAKDSDKQTLVDEDPSNSLMAKTKTFREDERFPDLRHKNVWRSKSLVEEPVPVLPAASGPLVHSSAVGLRGSESRVRPVELALLIQRDPDSIPIFLREIVSDLQLIRGVSIDLLTDSQHDGWTIPVTELTEEGAVDSRFSRIESDEMSRVRRASVFSFSCESDQMWAVVVESDPVYVGIQVTSRWSLGDDWKPVRSVVADYLGGAESATAITPLSTLVALAFGQVV